MPNPDADLRQGQLSDDFATRLSAAGGETLIAASLDDVVAIVKPIPGVTAPGGAWISERVRSAAPELPGLLRREGIPADVPASPDVVRDAPLGITVARLAIAETGSVLLHENDLAGRSVSLMTHHLIVLCPLESIVPSLDEASPALREIAANGPSYATFVTGPSRTADIERELAVGVQGPGALQVIFLPGVPPSSGSRHDEDDTPADPLN